MFEECAQNSISCGRGQCVLVASPLQEVRIYKMWVGLNGFDPRNDLVLSGVRIGTGCMNRVTAISRSTRVRLWAPDAGTRNLKEHVMCIIVLHLENIASQLVSSDLASQLSTFICTVSVPKSINWSSYSYCFVWSLTKFSPFLLSEVGWHPNSSAIDYVDTMAICIAIFHGFI